VLKVGEEEVESVFEVAEGVVGEVAEVQEEEL